MEIWFLFVRYSTGEKRLQLFTTREARDQEWEKVDLYDGRVKSRSRNTRPMSTDGPSVYFSKDLF